MSTPTTTSGSPVLATLERWGDRARSMVGGKGKKRWQVGLQPYRSYGTTTELRYAFRVLRDPEGAETSIHDSLWQNFKASLHRFESDEVPGAKVSVSVEDDTAISESDEEGYVNGKIKLSQPVNAGWQTLSARIDQLPYGKIQRGTYVTECLVPPDDASFGIISDIDDTVLHTQVKSRLKMVLSSVLGNAHRRLALPGVARLYRKLAARDGAPDANPVFYVSSSPWNLYQMLADFLDNADLPRGPVLLRDFGIGGGSSIGSDHSHKEAKIADIMETYPSLPFLLFGDSGEEDAAIYSRIAERFPGRVLCSYIRDNRHVDQTMLDAAQRRARAAGSELLLAADSDTMRAHAEEHGWLE